MDPATRKHQGIVDLPTSLDQALDLLQQHPKASEFVTGQHAQRHKRGGLKVLEGRKIDEICRM